MLSLRIKAVALALAVLPALASGSAMAVSAGPTTTSHGDRLVFHDADTETWQPCEGLPGCTTVLLRGNPATGASEAIFRFKAGTPFAAHYHTSPEHVLGVAGTMQYIIDGRVYHVGPGDYLYYPSRAVHKGQCTPGADCVFHVYDDLPYDIIPVG